MRITFEIETSAYEVKKVISCIAKGFECGEDYVKIIFFDKQDDKL